MESGALRMDEVANFKVRVHGGARRITLRIDREGAAIFTVPPQYDRSQLEALFVEQRTWVEQQRRLQAQVSARGRELPLLLDLRAVSTHFNVIYRDDGSTQPRIRQGDAHTVVLCGDLERLGDPSRLLCEWLKRYARSELTRLVERRSSEVNLYPRGVSVRSQRTRWGSCSSSGRLSLNMRLLFLPVHLAELVIDHELCHLVHMNHSAAFWDLLELVHPQARLETKELKRVSDLVPAWIR